jgi:hypothetical protein
MHRAGEGDRGQQCQPSFTMCQSIAPPCLRAWTSAGPNDRSEERWSPATDKRQVCPSFHPLDRLSSPQKKAGPARSRKPTQARPGDMPYDTGQGVERMVKRS